MITYLSHTCAFIWSKNQIIFSHYLYFEYISEWMQNYCLKYAKQVEITKKKSEITHFLIAANFFLLFSLYYCIFYCCLSILQSDAIFVLSGTKNDITGQKTISRDISFSCHRVIALIKAQVCDKDLIFNYIINLNFWHQPLFLIK